MARIEKGCYQYSVQVKLLLDSALSWRFAARRSAPSMVVPLTNAATLSAGRHESALRVICPRPRSALRPLEREQPFPAGRTLPGPRTNSLNPSI